MGRVFIKYLDAERIYTCKRCKAHISKPEDVISRAFMGKHGRAYLFRNIENIIMGSKEDRILITGLHTVADVTCKSCSAAIGWKYLYAFEESQKYKEGAFIIERGKICKESQSASSSFSV